MSMRKLRKCSHFCGFLQLHGKAKYLTGFYIILFSYAKQVSEYFEYVKRIKSLEVKVDASSQDTNARSLFMPDSSNLFMPNGSLMCAEAMKAKFDLRQQASGFPK